MRFVSASALDDARCRVRATEMKFGVQQKSAWLDVQRSEAERKPVKLIHRCHDICLELGAVKCPLVAFTKYPKDRRVKANGVLFAFVTAGKLRWTAKARELFTQDELDEIEGYADN